MRVQEQQNAGPEWHSVGVGGATPPHHHPLLLPLPLPLLMRDSSQCSPSVAYKKSVQV